MKFIDLSHTVSSATPVFPGDAPPSFTQRASRIEMSLHTGTHIDMPFHMVPGGKKLPEINIKKFAGRGVLIDARGKKEISDELLKNAPLQKGGVVIVMTGLSRIFGTKEYYENYPVISEVFARKIINAGASIVGMDTPSPDKAPYKIHKLLLAREILLIENLTNLEALIGIEYFEIFAFPPKFDADGSPVRVVAMLR